MVQAIFLVEIVYEHIPGHLNELADLLSRAHISEYQRQKAMSTVSALSLDIIKPCDFPINILKLCPSRSNPEDPSTVGDGATGHGTSTQDQRQPPISSLCFPEILPQIPVATLQLTYQQICIYVEHLNQMSLPSKHTM